MFDARYLCRHIFYTVVIKLSRVFRISINGLRFQHKFLTEEATLNFKIVKQIQFYVTNYLLTRPLPRYSIHGHIYIFMLFNSAKK